MSCLFVLIKNLYPSQIILYKIERKKDRSHKIGPFCHTYSNCHALCKLASSEFLPF